MSLLGKPLLVLLGLLTVLVPVGVLLLWEPLRGRGPVRWSARGGLVVLAQLTAVLFLAAALNDYGYFFGSWSEVWGGVGLGLGSGSAGRVVVHGPGGQLLAPRTLHLGIRIHSDHTFSTPAQWRRRGRLESVLIPGTSTGLRSQAFVYLPPQYFWSRYAHQEFPVAEVLSGYPGTDRVLVKRFRYQDVLLHDLRTHRAAPMVLVMVRPSVTFPRDTECTDVPQGPQAESFFTQDVPTQMARHYRVWPVGWGVIGDSTGGYCATKLAVDHPAAFPAAVSLSGYYYALRDSTTGDLWGGSALLRHLNSPEWRLAHLPQPPVSLLVTSSRGERGPLGYRDTQRFLRLVKPPLTVSTIIEDHGGHTFTTWQPELGKAVAWLSHRLPAVGGRP